MMDVLIYIYIMFGLHKNIIQNSVYTPILSVGISCSMIRTFIDFFFRQNTRILDFFFLTATVATATKQSHI